MTTWSFGGVALSTYGKVTMLDDDLDIPDKRGSNIVIPYQHGTKFVEKYYGERKMTFGIAIRTSTALAMETLIDSLKSNIGVKAQKTLSQTREDTSVRNALASVEANYQVDRETGIFARILLEFTLASPFFRASSAITNNTTTINTNPKAMVVTNPGTVEERNPTIILTGPLQNTVITNTTNGSVLSFTGTIASPRVVTIQTVDGEYLAADDLAANKISNLSHVGDASMLTINPGTNNLSIADSTHTTGTVQITFNAPYL